MIFENPLEIVVLLALALSTSLQGQSRSLPFSSQHGNKTLCPPVAQCIQLLDMGKECQILPVLDRSRLPLIEPGVFQVTPLRHGVWAYNDGAFLSLIAFVGDRLTLIDFPDSPGSNKPDGTMTRLTDAVEEVLGDAVPRRIDMIYSHSHYDHIGAGRRFYDFAKKNYGSAEVFIWGTEGTRQAIRISESKRAVEPNVIVTSKGATLTLAKDLQIRMEMVDGHTSTTDLLFFIPKVGSQKSVLMMVDIVFPRWSPFNNLALTDDVGLYIEVHNKMLKFNFDILVGGHLRLGTKKDVRDNLRFAKDLVRAAGTALRTVTDEDLANAGAGNFSDPLAPQFGNIWFAVIDVTRKLQIDACYRIMIEKWGCRISGLDSNLRTHCFIAIQYNLLDL